MNDNCAHGVIHFSDLLTAVNDTLATKAALRDLTARLERIEHQITLLIGIARRTDLTAAEEEAVGLALDDLKAALNEADKATAIAETIVGQKKVE